MAILSETVKIKLWGANIKHFNDLGYDGKAKDFIEVKVKDLQKGSNVKIQVQCDYCGKIFTRSYARYIQSISTCGKYACQECRYIKCEQYNLEHYGTKAYTSTEEFKEKSRKKCIEKYGADSYAKTDEGKERKKNTMLKRYGVESASQNPEIREKARQTCIERYGTPYPIQLPVFQEKAEQTCLKKYGVRRASQLPEIKEKVRKTMSENHKVNTSSQQVYLHNLFGGFLNYPISGYNADICFPDEKLVIEYNGGGHNLCVKTGIITQEEFDQKEIIRHNVLKKMGYKTMEIKSDRDKLPNDEILLKMLNMSRQYFSDFPAHSWFCFDISNLLYRNAENQEGVLFDYGKLQKIKNNSLKNDIDTSTVHNAEQRDGVFFNYGELRRIKKSDLQNEKNDEENYA